MGALVVAPRTSAIAHAGYPKIRERSLRIGRLGEVVIGGCHRDSAAQLRRTPDQQRVAHHRSEAEARGEDSGRKKQPIAPLLERCPSWDRSGSRRWRLGTRALDISFDRFVPHGAELDVGCRRSVASHAERKAVTLNSYH